MWLTRNEMKNTVIEHESQPADTGIKLKDSPPHGGINPRKITATTIIGDKIKDRNGNEIGKIEEVVFDLVSGKILYIVLSVGGFGGIGDKFFSIPLEPLTFDAENKQFYLDAEKEDIKKLPGFDKHNWPARAEWPPI